MHGCGKCEKAENNDQLTCLLNLRDYKAMSQKATGSQENFN